MFMHAAMAIEKNGRIIEDERAVNKEEMYSEMQRIRDLVVKKINPKINDMYKRYKKGRARLLIFNPNTGELTAKNRKWPVENWIELVGYLNRERGIKILFIGGKRERDETESLIGEIKSKIKDLKMDIENLAGRTSIEDLIALLNVGDVFITNDTGPMHLSALSKISVIALFGPETPTLFAPLTKNSHIIYRNLYCSPCATVFSGKISQCKNNICMQGISAAEVFKIYKSMVSAWKK
jgi:ADP-heptose:LPS heptosyltransferase